MKNKCSEVSQRIEDHLSYEQWFRARVLEALDDPSPGIPHDEVMREMKAFIESKLSLHPTD
ncbi:putative stability determinant [Pseudomonas synxantha]|uniref:type II toxin-antitoxin system RelB family antitoxin n=1 Tax=Pseudomonas TaxID=286 RepID=UPI000F579E9E|nr:MULTISPECIES: antitoxin [Pseudomonas]AZE71303.1 putative stability determinant [Pseudomonas synxantha]